MEKTRKELLPGVFLTILHTDKFKTNCLSLSLIRPLCREEAALNALLPDVMLRGCGMCPDMTAISAWLDQRYGAGIQSTVRKKGEVQAIGLFLDYINERYTLEGENLTEDICRLLGSFVMDPVLENGAFRADYVEGEKINLINAIASQINDKRTFASIRLREEMFRDEPYGVSKYGSTKDVAAITPEVLYAHYQNILATSQIELIFTGDADSVCLEKLGRINKIAEILRITICSLHIFGNFPISSIISLMFFHHIGKWIQFPWIICNGFQCFYRRKSLKSKL